MVISTDEIKLEINLGYSILITDYNPECNYMLFGLFVLLQVISVQEIRNSGINKVDSLQHVSHCKDIWGNIQLTVASNVLFRVSSSKMTQPTAQISDLKLYFTPWQSSGDM